MRWADTISASCPTPSASSVSAVCRMVAQSDWEPMMMATGFSPFAAACGIDASRRPETLAAAEFGALAAWQG